MCSARSRTGLTVTVVSGLPHQGRTCSAVDRAPGCHSGPARRRHRSGCRGAAAARCTCSTTCRRGARLGGAGVRLLAGSGWRSRTCWPRARSPRAMGPAHLERLGATRGEQQGVRAATATSRSRPSARSRPPSSRTTPSDADLGQVDVQVPLLRRPRPGRPRPAAGRTWPGPRDRPHQLAPGRSCAPPARRGCPRTPRHRGTGTWWRRRSSRAATPPTGRPARRLPAAGEPVDPSTHRRQEPATRLRGLPEGGGELGDRELRDPRTPGPAERETGLVPGLHRTDQGVLGVHRGELRPRRSSCPGRPGHSSCFRSHAKPSTEAG